MHAFAPTFCRDFLLLQGSMEDQMNNKYKSISSTDHIRKLCAVSIFCALAYICVFLIRFKVSFLTFDLKDAIMAIGSMYFGPIYAVVMPVAVSLLEFLTISDTGPYGLIMNFLSSAAFCVVASSIYKFRKTISGAVISLITAVVAMTGVMLAANLFITPYYMHVTIETVRGLIPGLLLPFNLIKGIVNASVVMLLYKPFSTALKASGIIRKSSEDIQIKKMPVISQIVVAVVSVCVLAAALVSLFFFLDASIA
ncbi:MAG: ECF transporter S component [Ruminococcaceae bacterium]|nr:ECF transporter S component [Oscillospiraceae bacterium]